jgi:hypothetical protein
MGTAVGLATDLHEGMIERFRVLPMWRPAVLVGRSLADLLTDCLCALVVAVTGLAVGWRTSAGPLAIIAGADPGRGGAARVPVLPAPDHRIVRDRSGRAFRLRPERRRACGQRRAEPGPQRSRN